MKTEADRNVIGKPWRKVDSLGSAVGRTVYTDDMSPPGMLIAKQLHSIHAHAIIRSIGTSRAEALEGVHAVITGADLPVAYGIFPVSQDEHALAVERVRYVGEPVAAIAAVDEETAERALALVEVEYEPLAEVTTFDTALADDQPLIHGKGQGANIHRSNAFEFGDLVEGFALADHIREDVLFYSGNNHAAMEQHAALAEMGADGRLTLWSSTQVPHYVHRTLEKVLELPASRIRVIAPAVGGGFGGKTDPFSHEITASKLAMVTGRPVKITLTREEVFYTHRGRHPVLMWVKTGFTEDGKITAMHFRSLLDGGAYGSYGAASTLYTGALQTTTYRIPAYRFEGVRVFTNKPPCGPKRGHGTPQPRFALEVHLDKAADELGIDPVELRRRNLTEPFSKTVNHLRITSNGLRECLDEVVAASDYTARRGAGEAGRGVGFAVGAYMSGAGLPIYWNDMAQSEVQIKVDRGGGVTVYSMAADVGQGSTSVLAAVVAEVLGLSTDDLSLVTADTDLTPIDLGSYSSRVTFMAGNAALEAATRLRDVVFGAVADHFDVPQDRLVAVAGTVGVAGDGERTVPWAEAVRLAAAAGDPLTSSGSYTPPDLAGPYKGSGVGPSPAYSYSACVAAVTCDPETGFVEVDKVWLAHDVGRSINPLLVEGQIEGSVHMALGEVLSEEQAFRGGMHFGPSLLDYKIPSILEMPPVESIIIETNDPEGPFGAKEAGQGPLLPVLPAIANAVHDALGVRVDELPITPWKVLQALRDLDRGGEGRVGPERLPDVPYRDPYRIDPPPEFQGSPVS
ncbi:MAG: molybdopterin cofactor-binding domain-containing protein [Acidimicrobiia bacterium]